MYPNLSIAACIAVILVAVGVSSQCWSQAAIQPVAPATSSGTAQGAAGITPVSNGADPLLDLPPLPRTTVSLIGGTIARLDPIRDELVLHAFGGRDVKIQFDVRTQVLQGDQAVSVRELRAGTRVYADTILKDGRVFAKALRIAKGQAQGEATGQVIDYDPTEGALRVRDSLSAAPFLVRLSSQTTIDLRGQTSSTARLVPGSLVRIWFGSGVDQRNARKIEVLALPGETFSFAGKITFVDFRAGYVVIEEMSGTATHEIALDDLPSDAKLQLKEGMDVVVSAKFDGKNYQARTLEMSPKP